MFFCLFRTLSGQIHLINFTFLWSFCWPLFVSFFFFFKSFYCLSFDFRLLITPYHLACNKANTTGATSRSKTAYHSGKADFVGFVLLNLEFSVFCRLLSIFFWPLYCRSTFGFGLFLWYLQTFLLLYFTIYRYNSIEKKIIWFLL